MKMIKEIEHLTIEEASAVSEGRFELLAETEKHVENCSECSNLLRICSETGELFKQSADFIPETDDAKIAAAAEKSFAFLPFEESSVEEEPARKISIFSFVASLLKPALAFSAAVVLVVCAVFLVKNKPENETEEPEIVTAGAENEREEPVEIPQENGDGLKKSGSNIKFAKATMSVISDSYVKNVSEDSLTLNSGKAKFDVVSGTDFRIDVDGKFLVRVLGTSFTLDYSGGNLAVNVFDGMVEVVENSTGKSVYLTKNMNLNFNSYTSLNKVKPAVNTNKAANSEAKDRKVVLTPDKSFLLQGREALSAGKTGIAQQLFMLEIEKGKEADKALFELVSIHESKKDYGEVVSLLTTYGSVFRESRVYKEDLMFKGCLAQKKSGGSSISLCNEYLKEFPRSFRSKKVRRMINE